MATHTVSPEPPHDELDKMLASRDTAQTCGQFLDWLRERYTLCTYVLNTTCGTREYEPAPPFSTEQLLAEYLEIDLGLVDRERQALLEYMRNREDEPPEIRGPDWDATDDRPKISVEQWNARCPVGTPVRYHPIWPPGTVAHVDTKTRSEAWALGGGEVVAKIEGKAGGVCVSHLEVLEG